jgi:hypothetical protein
MAHVSSAVREMYLDSLAAAFAAGGLAPLVSGTRNIQRVVRQDFLASSRAAIRQDRVTRFRGGPPAMAGVGRPRRRGRLGPAHHRDWLLEHRDPAR